MKMLKNKSDKFTYSSHTTNKRGLLPKFLNKTILGKENQILIRETFGRKDRYQVYVNKIGNKYNYLYNQGALTATKVVEIAERYDIDLT